MTTYKHLTNYLELALAIATGCGGTAFHLAKRAGVTVAHQGAVCRGADTLARACARVREDENMETEEESDEELQPPWQR